VADDDVPLEVVADRIDRAIIQSRLNALAFMMLTDRVDRLTQIATVLTRLRTGTYLIGTGPSTVGIIPLTVDEVLLGRAATPVEEPSETVVDYQVADTAYLGPHEVSRTHAKIMRNSGSNGSEYRIVDLGSRLGTFVNGAAVGAKEPGRLLSAGDLISLGQSQVSTYVVVECRAAADS
jgi:pSer/pThr/pTyr-binding forkhead associated (FHA) protein